MKDEFTVLGVSPSPLALVQQAEYEGPEEISRMHAFFLDGSSREVPAPEGSEVFAELDELIAFFGSEFV